MEDMVDRLEAIVKHALWEVVTEYFMMPNDFTGSTSMNGQCHECLNKEVEYIVLDIHKCQNLFRKNSTVIYTRGRFASLTQSYVSPLDLGAGRLETDWEKIKLTRK